MILKRGTKAYDIIMKYYDKHDKCPRCGSKIVETSVSPPEYKEGVEYKDRKNKTNCSNQECGWSGFIDECR